ncbi:MAG: hypothetical protein IPG47_04675 [Thermoflexaceae bacterium]|nr:hypothetical protein [Thermoflexaceae bacterium]
MRRAQPQDTTGVIRGEVIAFVLFAASFALHIVAGAMDQGWLFAIAVVLIYISATGFPAIAAWTSRVSSARARWLAVIVGVPFALLFTGGALWAANGRAMAWWVPPAAIVLISVGTGSILAIRSALVLRRGGGRSTGTWQAARRR